MLEQETFLMEGQEGKDMDKIVKEYHDVCQQLEDLEKVKKKLSNTIKTVCESAGTYETYNWYWVIYDKAGAEKISDKGKKFIRENYPEYIEHGEPCKVLKKPEKKGSKV